MTLILSVRIDQLEVGAGLRAAQRARPEQGLRFDPAVGLSRNEACTPGGGWLATGIYQPLLMRSVVILFGYC